MEDSHMPGKLAMAANANPQAKIAPFPNPSYERSDDGKCSAVRVNCYDQKSDQHQNRTED